MQERCLLKGVLEFGDGRIGKLGIWDGMEACVLAFE